MLSISGFSLRLLSSSAERSIHQPAILLVPIGAVLLLATAVYISLTLPRR